MSIGSFPESLRQAILVLVWIILVRILAVARWKPRVGSSQVPASVRFPSRPRARF